MYAPTHLFYLTSLRCNERCTKCSHWRVRKHPPMVETALLVEAVRDVRSARVMSDQERGIEKEIEIRNP